MVDGLKSRLARAAAGVAALALAFGLGGCSLATPSLDEAVDDAPAQAIADSELVQAGTLTVALDTSDAPQVITGTDGELVGYDIDVATALAENMGLKVSFVNATSPSSALQDGEADIYLGATASDESGDISTETSSFLPVTTARTAPPPELASNSRCSISCWSASMSCCIFCACFIRLFIFPGMPPGNPPRLAITISSLYCQVIFL